MNPKIKALLVEAGHCLLLAALGCAVLYPAVFGGRLPLDTSALFEHTPWHEAAPPDYEPSQDDGLLDHAEVYGPNYRFISDSVARGESLAWDPLNNSGGPFFADISTRTLSPFTIPFYLFEFAAALRISALLKVIIAGWAAYYASRRLGFQGPLALLIAAAFETGASFALFAVTPVTDVLAWTPLLFG